jgi:hypothetical protein
VTDPELAAQKLARIETCVRELRSLARPEAMRHDVRERRFVEHTLQIAIQAALDVASHIVSDERLGEPETNRVSVSVFDGRSGDDFTLDVDPAKALDAFHHPYSLSAARGARREAEPTPV